MKILHDEEDRVIIRLKDGTVLTVLEPGAIQAKCIPGRRKSEKKYMELPDLYVFNDAIKQVYPQCHCNDRNKVDCD